MVLAAESVGPPWVAITLAILAAVATVITAVMPAIVERLKRRRAEEQQPTAQTDEALDLIKLSLLDVMKQRDALTSEVAHLKHLLAEREAELRRRGWNE